MYAKGWKNLNAAELTRLQDDLARHLVRLAREFEFPVQFHTGDSTPSTLGHPENLYNLCRDPEFSRVQFYFCHAGRAAEREALRIP